SDQALLLIVTRHQADQELTAQAAHRAGGGQRGMQVADSDRGVDSRTRQGGHHRACEVAFLQGPDAGARPRDLRDQLLMTRSLEDGDGQVLNTNVAGEGDAAEVVGDRIVEVDRATRAGSSDELLHLGYRGQLREPSRPDRDQERDGVEWAARDL